MGVIVAIRYNDEQQLTHDLFVTSVLIKQCLCLHGCSPQNWIVIFR